MQNTQPFFYQLFASEKDIAGKNILSFIDPSLQPIATLIKEESIFADKEVKNFTKNKKSSIIFLSRHSAKSLRPSFTVHPIGNFSEAAFGGRDSILIPCDAYLMKTLYENILELFDSGNYNFKYNYEISVEATHHGPYAQNPITYIEVGSAPDQWEDLEACRLIADAVNITEFSSIQDQKSWISCIGFGGNHYPMKFSKQMSDTDNALGHMCAKYAIPFLTKDLVKQMIEKTYPRPQIALFDKKSMKRKQEIRSWLDEYDIIVKQI
jgi:D-aminoacyl-tRNA deacylase